MKGRQEKAGRGEGHLFLNWRTEACQSELLLRSKNDELENVEIMWIAFLMTHERGKKILKLEIIIYALIVTTRK